MNPYRHLINGPVIVRLHDGRTVNGVLHSVITRTAWMLVPHGNDSFDEFVDMADISEIDVA
jgi:hypothetical protein